VFRAGLTDIQVGPLTFRRRHENLPRLSSQYFGPIKQLRHTRPDDPAGRQPRRAGTSLTELSPLRESLPNPDSLAARRCTICGPV